MTNPIVYPAPSYGPAAAQQQIHDRDSYARPATTLSVRKEEKANPYQQITATPQQKMVSYFSSCLEVLGIQDEVALTEDSLKKAYKRIALKAHPDKGGSEEHFEAITRAYAYLSEILKRIQGGRDRPLQEVSAPSTLASGRAEEAKAWQHVEPVRLNPQKLDVDAFNKMFEQTHMPDPDSDGYGDWLKSQGGGGAGAGAGASAPKFKGEFNRSVFNKMFDEEARKQNTTKGSREIIHLNDMAMTMAPTMGLEIGRARPDTYTAAPNSKQQYTDLQDAYEHETTISDKVANVRMEERTLESYKANREKGPAPMTDRERAGVAEAERMYAERERSRQQRAAMQATAEQDYFERMKRLVITDGR
jgi:curved DNA-binding protein CbpA